MQAARYWKAFAIQKGVAKTADRAFADCKALKKVSIPASVTYIRYKAFYECRAPHEVTVPTDWNTSVLMLSECIFIYKYIEGLKFPREEYRRYSDFHICCTEGSRAECYSIENRLHYST